jgi:hypothetical protein
MYNASGRTFVASPIMTQTLREREREREIHRHRQTERQQDGKGKEKQRWGRDCRDLGRVCGNRVPEKRPVHGHLYVPRTSYMRIFER